VQKGFNAIGYQVSFSSKECLEIFSSPHPNTKILGPTQPPAKQAPCIFPKDKAKDVDLTIHSHHVPRLRLGTELFLLNSMPGRHAMRRDFIYRLFEIFIN
jgi:hypothetical protein